MQRLEMWLTRNILILENILGVPVEDFSGGVLFLLLCIISYPDGRYGYEINPFDACYQKGRLFRNFQYHAFKLIPSPILLLSQTNWKLGMQLRARVEKDLSILKSSRHLVQGWLPSHSTSYISKFQFPGQNASRNYEGIGDIHAGIKTMRNNFNLPPRPVREKPWRQVWHRHKNRYWTDERALPYPFKSL